MKMTKMTALLLAAVVSALTEIFLSVLAVVSALTVLLVPVLAVVVIVNLVHRRNGGYLPADRYRPAGPRSYH